MDSVVQMGRVPANPSHGDPVTTLALGLLTLKRRTSLHTNCYPEEFSILTPHDSQHPTGGILDHSRALSVTGTGSKLSYFKQLKVRVIDRQA